MRLLFRIWDWFWDFMGRAIEEKRQYVERKR